MELALFGLAGALVLALLALVFALRGRSDSQMPARIDALVQSNERLERELRAAIDTAAAAGRIETGTRLTELHNGLVNQVASLANVQTTQLGQFGQQVARIAELTEASARANREESAQQLGALAAAMREQLAALAQGADAASRANREEAGKQLTQFATSQQQQLADLTQAIQLNLGEVRTTLGAQLQSLQQGNETKLDQMRATVEEKLQTTLEARLGESFKQVSERLEEVHRGLGEMRGLAQGVGDLKRVLTNVKTRGGYGEVQLGALLEQILTPEQYATNVVTRPGSRDRVEFAIRLPGQGQGDSGPVWLPIDAKFPVEDYERLQSAQERADLAAVEDAARALENRVRLEAKTIREKYVEPPHTTDFALLFLPTEGLYAEVLRRPGLVEALQREQKIIIAGPTTLAAMLNSLQMGFRTLAIEKRSAEVWNVLGAVKTEFEKFGGVLEKLKGQLASASKTIESAEVRTRQMSRKLREVEALPATEAAELLPDTPAEEG
ncbi:MAG: DNA recombination protein RmuC [Burkholderiaceae bacterium]